MSILRLLLLVSLLCCPSVFALPAYSRLYQAKYGYRTSCNLCHTAGGGSSVTDYGRDFLRAGGNFSAFIKVEKLDSDGDGTINIDEITSKSNPGDAKSVPSKSGDWLADADRVSVPEKDLKKLFPSAEAFSALEGTLKESQLKPVESQIGKSLNEEDKVPTFYFAISGGKKFAVAQFVSAWSAKGPVSIAVAMDTKGTVTNVRVLKNPSDKAIEDEGFLSQFAGKSKSNSLQIGSEIKPAKDNADLSREVSLAVKKAILMINAVFGK